MRRKFCSKPIGNHIDVSSSVAQPVDNVPYMLKQIHGLEEKVKTYTDHAKSLIAHIQKKTWHQLLLVEKDIDEDSELTELRQKSWKYNYVPSKKSFVSLPKFAVSPKTIARMNTVVNLLRLLFIQLAEVHVEKVKSLRKRLSIVLDKETRCSSDDELVADVVQHHMIARKQVAVKVLEEQRLTSEQFATRKLLTIFNQYLKLGGIKQDGRGKWIRKDFKTVLPGMHLMILKFVKTEKLVTCGTVRLFINEEIQRRVAEDDERMKQLGIHFDADDNEVDSDDEDECDTACPEDVPLQAQDETEVSLRATLGDMRIAWKNGISVATAHHWMLESGCRYCYNNMTYYTDKHNHPEVVKFRNEYIDHRDILEERMPMWCKTSSGEFEHVDKMVKAQYLEFRAGCGERGGMLKREFVNLTDEDRELL